ncbi:MAG: acyl-CoA hydrolase [Glaciecola sp.]|jgi:acyl-CoA hydrolase|uniref:acyl-CoA thioesterase n=1 Tax=Congregibacter sp. TaxID=2744308 RepID=UPI0039E4DFF5
MPVEQQADGHTVSYSQTTLTELMIPAYANFGGKIHGGTLLSLMDKVAYVCASKHAGNYCVTVSVDNVHFLAPVEVGDLVSLMASVNYVGSSSLVVGIKVIAENVQTATVKHTNTSYFTMVAKSQGTAKAMVPPLILESVEDIRRFAGALRRRRLRRYMTERMDEYRAGFVVDEETRAFLANERCEIRLGS